jgi:hypothetical protein
MCSNSFAILATRQNPYFQARVVRVRVCECVCVCVYVNVRGTCV